MQESTEREGRAPQDSPQEAPKQENPKPQTAEGTPNKKPKAKFADDGHTVYSMEALTGKVPEEKDRPKLTRKERWALVRAAFSHYFPPVLIVLGSFTLVALLMYLWLK